MVQLEDSPQRWLPVGFVFGPNGIAVRWMDFGPDPIVEPFFWQTVRKLKSADPPARERTTNVRVLTAMASKLPPVAVSGVIFHVSRCGSTLVSNALRAGDGVTVLSEAGPVGTFFRPDLFENSPLPSERWEETRKTLFDCVIRLFAHGARAVEPKVVIKCHAASVLSVSLVRSVWPDIPFVVLIRDPVEVIVSNLEKSATWVKVRNKPEAASKVFGWPAAAVERMTAEEYCARGIGRFCECASQVVDERCWVIDYEHLDLWSLYGISSFFRIALPPSNSPIMQRVLSSYTKDPAQLRQFEDDRVRKQHEASESVREAARRWAEKPYQALKALEASHCKPYGRAV